MPYASDAQRRFFNVPKNRKRLEAEGVDVDEWNEASEGRDLPERAKRRKKDKAAADLFEFLPNDVHARRMEDAVADITKASSDLTAQLEQIRGDAHRVTHHTGQAGQAREKLADASTAISPGQTQAPIGTVAPSTIPTQFNMAADQLACFEHHDTPWMCPWTWQGRPQQSGDASCGPALGYPIASGKLGNGPGIGGLGGGGGVPVEKTADDKYAALADWACGDLTVKDREDLGTDFHDRMAGDKQIMFLTQGGELGLLEHLHEKYPQGRQSGGVLLGHRKTADLDVAATCSADQVSLEKDAAPAWLSNLAGRASQSMTGWDPTLKSGIVGAGLGAGIGGLAGGLNRIGGGYRPPISEEMAQQLQGLGIDPAIIQKLINPEREGELGPDEIQQLSQAGIDYDEIAPKSGYLSNMLGGVAKGGLIGGGLGALGGVAGQELPRLLVGRSAPGAAGAKAESHVPDWAPDWARDWTKNIGAAVGNQAWKGMPRQQQFNITEQVIGGPLPASMIDSALGRLSK